MVAWRCAAQSNAGAVYLSRYWTCSPGYLPLFLDVKLRHPLVAKVPTCTSLYTYRTGTWTGLTPRHETSTSQAYRESAFLIVSVDSWLEAGHLCGVSSPT